MSVLNKLTEGLVNRDLKKEGEAVVSKWDRTGLLEGLNGNNRSTMARLLENQAKELLREASSMAAGDVEGFAAVAFPIVRRVFGGLVANDLVSVQPMSLPSGLIFFLDFSYESDRLGSGDVSVYGGGVLAAEITGGVSDITEAGGGFYNLANAYSSPTGSVELDASAKATVVQADFNLDTATEAQKKSVQYDPDLLAANFLLTVTIANSDFPNLNTDMVKAMVVTPDAADSATQVRRLTSTDGTDVTFVFSKASAAFTDAGADNSYDAGSEILTADWNITYPRADAFGNADGAIGAVVGQDVWGLEEPSPQTGNAGSSDAAPAQGKNTIADLKNQNRKLAMLAARKV